MPEIEQVGARALTHSLMAAMLSRASAQSSSGRFVPCVRKAHSAFPSPKSWRVACASHDPPELQVSQRWVTSLVQASSDP